MMLPLQATVINLEQAPVGTRVTHYYSQGVIWTKNENGTWDWEYGQNEKHYTNISSEVLVSRYEMAHIVSIPKVESKSESAIDPLDFKIEEVTTK